jgi:tetratricopeptide (TPR) repeat protein
MRTGKAILHGAICSLLYLGAYTQSPWHDSVKHVAAIQKNDTNRVRTLINLCDAYAFTFPDTAFAYGKQAFDLAERLDFDWGRLYSLISLNSALYAMSNYTLELDYARKLIPLSKRMDDINATGFSFGAVGDSWLNLGEYNMALKYYRKVLAIGINKHLPELHRMYSGMAPVYLGTKQYDSALYYAKTGIDLFRKSDYYSSGNWDTRWSESGVYNAMGNVLEATGEHDSALYYYRKSLSASEVINMRYNILAAYLGMAKVFRKQQQFDSSKRYARNILVEKSRSLYPMSKQQAAGILAEIYEEEHNADSALKYLHISIQLKDSLYNRERIMAFQNILSKENDREYALQTATAELKNRYRLYFTISASVIAFLIAAIIIRNRKKRQLQDIRNNIANDLHDDIGSTLSSIRINNELAKLRSPDALSLLNSIGENTAAMQDNMSYIIWAVNPRNDHFGNIVRRMNVFAAGIADAKKIRLRFDSDAALNSTRITMKQRKRLRYGNGNNRPRPHQPEAESKGIKCKI